MYIQFDLMVFLLYIKLNSDLQKLFEILFFTKTPVANINSWYYDKTDSNTIYDEEDIIRMLNFLIGNIFVVFGGTVFQQTIGIPMGTNCAPLLKDIYLYSYEPEIVQKLLSNKQNTLAASIF